MSNRGQLVLGIAVVALGVALLLENLFDVDVWALCWPTGLILLGLWVLFRPQLFGSSAKGRQRLFGDIRRDGIWQVSDGEYWIGIGDVRLDMKEAEIPAGDTHIRVWSFVGDVRLYVPQDVGVSVFSSAFVAGVRLFGAKRDRILSPLEMTSDNYETAERRIRLETTSFVGDVRIERA